MAADLYSDTEAPAPTTAEEPAAGSKETTLIPKSMCPGMSPGDTVEFKIVRAHDKEYEVEYTGGEKESEETTEEMPPEAPPPMMQGGGPSMME